MGKIIIIDKGEEKTMTFEEVLVKFRPLMKNLMNHFRYVLREFDDRYQIASIGLWKAYECYDINKKIGFWVLAKKTIENDFKWEHNYNNRQKRTGITFSIDYPIMDKRGEEHSLIETLESDEDIQATVVMKNTLIEFMGKLTDKQKEALALYQSGKRYKDIAKILGVSRQNISMRMTASRKIFNSL